ncbi:MAG: methyltransferase domain-containing protein [Oscillospiraceae bacterium]|nr:methyltransferase domain-containing protein [Oscillospiraceae bacterium]
MNFLHPGEYEIIDTMLKKCSPGEGSAVLDLGCGRGDTSAHMAEVFSLNVTGADISEAMLDAAREAHPELDFVKCDGRTLPFEDNTFDMAVMECSFSLMHRQMELLGEIRRVLKSGATVIISDVYMLNPDMARANRNFMTARRELSQHEDSYFFDDEYPSPYCLDGMFVKDLLIDLLESAGFTVEEWCDRSGELLNYAAQLLMDYGSFEAAKKAILPPDADCCCFCNAKLGKNTGYFILQARSGVKKG